MIKSSLQLNFEEYLKRVVNVSKNTLKFYRSDLSHFTGWIILKLRTSQTFVEDLQDALPYINKEKINEYLEYLSENKSPVKTVNRKLSTLRHLSRFLTYNGYTETDFMEGISNSGTSIPKKTEEHPLVEEFEKHLQEQKASKNTIKNYLSDVKHFISWLEENKTHA